MQYAELLKKPATELAAMKTELRLQLTQLERQLTVRGVKNVRELRQIRKDIARIETRLTALSREAAPTA